MLCDKAVAYGNMEPSSYSMHVHTVLARQACSLSGCRAQFVDYSVFIVAFGTAIGPMREITCTGRMQWWLPEKKKRPDFVRTPDL